MDAHKESLLRDTYEKTLQLSFLDDKYPLSQADKLIANEVMGLGTNANEIIFSINEYQKLIQLQRDQLMDVQVKYKVDKLFHRVYGNENVAIFIDKISIEIESEPEPFQLIARFSFVFEFKNEEWKLVHWHGSVPMEPDDETDTWLLEESKRKQAELEAIIAENTIELKKQNQELEQKKKEIEEANQTLRASMRQLKATQAQLIQSEKLASLGELTAGIAHEIQNPLNFVNNFSEVSTELVDEMLEELKKGDTEEVEAISDDLKQNLEKILHHGKRAQGIVSGMLEHSRASSGEKKATDLNALADEYLRLAYHGLRAKDKSFNADFETDLAENLPKIEVVSQDIGRVLLNLINNAFYAVHQKSKLNIADYQPKVKVSTKLMNDTIEIKIQDNGTGMPDSVKEKIFQPFFTTKPTGQGTGLGLSLSYDIIKAHGGSLKVETKEGEFTQFFISLPK